ncbi:MAG TPA: hypothetical protein ENI27_03430 [bacterium]|nr:hypothetical protein [bacterium]
MKISVVTPTTAEPLSLEEVKDHLRIGLGETEEDELLEGFIATARAKAEEVTNYKLQRQTLKLYIDAWPANDCIELPFPPLSTDTAPILQYKKSNSSTVTVGSSVWIADPVSEPARLCLEYNESWPSDTLHNVNPISVQYLCGYSTNVPSKTKSGMKLMIGDLYENRESIVVGQPVNEISGAVLNLLQGNRIFNF